MSGREAVRYQGEIVEWSDEKRFGFIRPRGSKGRDGTVFLPASAFVNRKRLPEVGDIVQYEVERARIKPGQRLRTEFRAVMVTFVGEEPPLRAPRKVRTVLILSGLVYWGALSTASTLAGWPHWATIASVLLSALAFLVYGWDKLMALKGAERVPETNLHSIALLGGWPGCAIAQSVFGHKTMKPTFVRTFYATVVINVFVNGLVFAALFATR